MMLYCIPIIRISPAAGGLVIIQNTHETMELVEDCNRIKLNPVDHGRWQYVFAVMFDSREAIANCFIVRLLTLEQSSEKK